MLKKISSIFYLTNLNIIFIVSGVHYCVLVLCLGYTIALVLCLFKHFSFC